MGGAVPTFLRFALASTTSADFWWPASPAGKLMSGSIGVRPGEVAHGRSDSGLGTGLCRVAEAIPGGPWPQGAAALGAGVCAGSAGPGGAQERAADGGADCACRLRPAAPLHQQPGLADRPARSGAGARGGPPRGRAGGDADHRRHRAAQEGRALGRGRSAIRRRAGEDGELPGPGLAHPGPRRGAGARGAAALPAQDLVPGPTALRQGGGAGGLPRLPQQGGDRARRDSIGSGRPASASVAPWPTAAMAAAPPSAVVLPAAPRSGRWASRRRRRSTPPR